MAGYRVCDRGRVPGPGLRAQVPPLELRGGEQVGGALGGGCQGQAERSPWRAALARDSHSPGHWVRGHVPSRALGRGPLVPPGQTGRELCVSAFGAPPSKHHHLWLHPWGQSFGETQTERLGLEGAGVARGWEEPMNRGERAAGGGGCTHSRAGARLRCTGRAPQLVGATLRGWSRRLSVCHVGPGSGPGEPLGPDLPTRGHSISLASMRGVAWVPAGLGQRGATGLPLQRPLRGLQSLVLTPAHSTEVPMEATRGRGSGQWWGPDAAWRM